MRRFRPQYVLVALPFVALAITVVIISARPRVSAAVSPEPDRVVVVIAARLMEIGPAGAGDSRVAAIMASAPDGEAVLSHTAAAGIDSQMTDASSAGLGAMLSAPHVSVWGGDSAQITVGTNAGAPYELVLEYRPVVRGETVTLEGRFRAKRVEGAIAQALDDLGLPSGARARANIHSELKPGESLLIVRKFGNSLIVVRLKPTIVPP